MVPHGGQVHEGVPPPTHSGRCDEITAREVRHDGDEAVFRDPVDTHVGVGEACGSERR